VTLNAAVITTVAIVAETLTSFTTEPSAVTEVHAGYVVTEDSSHWTVDSTEVGDNDDTAGEGAFDRYGIVSASGIIKL